MGGGRSIRFGIETTSNESGINIWCEDNDSFIYSSMSIKKKIRFKLWHMPKYVIDKIYPTPKQYKHKKPVGACLSN